MAEFFELIKSNPQWAVAFISIAANVYIVRQWVKAIDKNAQMAVQFGGAIEANNVRLDVMQRTLENLKP